MNKGFKILFIVLEPVSFISPFFLYSVLGDSLLGRIICFLPPFILLIWSGLIIRKHKVLAGSGLVVILFTIIIFLMVSVPSYKVYKERQETQVERHD